MKKQSVLSGKTLARLGSSLCGSPNLALSFSEVASSLIHYSLPPLRQI